MHKGRVVTIVQLDSEAHLDEDLGAVAVRIAKDVMAELGNRSAQRPCW